MVIKNQFKYFLKLINNNEIFEHSKIINVCPDRITYFVYPGFYKESRKYRKKGGDWDKRRYDVDVREIRNSSGNVPSRSLFKLEEYYLYKAMKSRYVHDCPWEDTEFFEIALNKIHTRGSFWHGCENRQELQDRCDGLDKIFEEIKTQGYKSQLEIGGAPSNEVNINVTRSGEFVLDDGRHRLIMAKILNITSIPAKVTVVHEDFGGNFNTI